MNRASQAAYIEQNNATGRVSFWQAGDNHSVADRRGVSLFEYIHAIYGLLRQTKARQVLMIGCGGGTLATMLHRAKVKVTLVEIDPKSLQIARDYFNLPESIETHLADGAAFLRHDPRRYDAIVLDAYANEAIPKVFRKPAFYALAKARLKRGGMLLVNVIVRDDEDQQPARLAALAYTAFRDVRLLDAVGWEDRNAVLAAGNVKKLKAPRLLMKPERSAKKIAAGLKTLAFRERTDL